MKNSINLNHKDCWIVWLNNGLKLNCDNSASKFNCSLLRAHDAKLNLIRREVWKPVWKHQSGVSEKKVIFVNVVFLKIGLSQRMISIWDTGLANSSHQWYKPGFLDGSPACGGSGKPIGEAGSRSHTKVSPDSPPCTQTIPVQPEQLNTAQKVHLWASGMSLCAPLPQPPKTPNSNLQFGFQSWNPDRWHRDHLNDSSWWKILRPRPCVCEEIKDVWP